MRYERILLVTGLGRCGTTLVMHMLRAAGVPVVGPAPDFEMPQKMGRAPDLEWLDSQRGKAVKWIDPTLCRIAIPADDRYRAIFLTRDSEQQANSQLKLVGAPTGRAQRRAMAAAVEKDARHAKRIVTRLCGDYGVLSMRFEKILSCPQAEANRIARFCDAMDLPFGSVLDAAAQVMRRSPRCMPDLSIEQGLYAAEARA